MLDNIYITTVASKYYLASINIKGEYITLYHWYESFDVIALIPISSPTAIEQIRDYVKRIA